MNNWLLDAEVLLALVWPRHEGHHAAHAWFAETGRSGWASNTLTQLGALRLLTHPAVTKGAVSPSEAVRIVDAMTAHPAHEFWPLEEMPLKVWGDVVGRIRTRRHWTHARLLFEAERRDGGVVTFDEGMKSLVGERLPSRVIVLR
jgi:toxin-antitoxin system PIN domain toxin